MLKGESTGVTRTLEARFMVKTTHSIPRILKSWRVSPLALEDEKSLLHDVCSWPWTWFCVWILWCWNCCDGLVWNGHPIAPNCFCPHESGWFGWPPRQVWSTKFWRNCTHGWHMWRAMSCPSFVLWWFLWLHWPNWKAEHTPFNGGMNMTGILGL